MTATEYAKRELSKYLRLMTGCIGAIDTVTEDDKNLFREEFTIDVKEGKGVIRANRPRTRCEAKVWGFCVLRQAMF